MKCPDCGFVCSELRDLCPKCLVDMREFKRSVGLPVSHPRASYDYLLARTTGSTSVGSGSAGTPRSSDEPPVISVVLAPLSKFISSFMNRSNHTPTPPASVDSPSAAELADEIPPPCEQESSRQALPSVELEPSAQEPHIVASTPEADPSPAISPPLPECPSDMETSFQEPPSPHILFAIPEVEAAPSDDNATKELSGAMHSSPAPSALAPEVSDSKGSASLPSPRAEETDPPEDSSRCAYVREEPFPEPLEPRLTEMPETSLSIETPPLFDSPSFSALSRIDSLDASALHRHGFDLCNIDESIELMFAESLRELLQDQRPLAFELSAEHFFSMKGREDIEVLFEMSREALIDPDSERRYVSTVALSENRVVDAGEASTYLKKLEVLSSTPVVTLRGAGGLSISGRPLFPHEPEPPPPLAPIWRRMVAFCCDGIFGILLAWCFSLTLLFSGPLSLNEVITGSRVIGSLDLIEIALWWTIGFLFLWPSAIAISLAIWSRTLGQWFVGLQARSLRGRKLGVSQSVVWSFSLPLSLATGGSLLPLAGRATLHEWAARALVSMSVVPRSPNDARNGSGTREPAPIT